MLRALRFSRSLRAALASNVLCPKRSRRGLEPRWISGPLLLKFGQNLLLQNRGDGTSKQIDAPEMRRDVQKNPDWSVSGAIADLNGDHLPDLVEVNYTAGIEAIVHECLNSDKVVQVCRPTELPASLDRIYLNSGDGQLSVINKHGN